MSELRVGPANTLLDSYMPFDVTIMLQLVSSYWHFITGTPAPWTKGDAKREFENESIKKLIFEPISPGSFISRTANEDKNIRTPFKYT